MHSEAHQAQPASILVVDDEVLIREFISTALQLDGYDVCTAPDAASALEIIESRKGEIGLVIVDVCMPDMDGSEMLEALRTRAAELPAVLMSGHSQDQLDVGALRGGTIGYLQKPFTRARLLEQIRARMA